MGRVWYKWDRAVNDELIINLVLDNAVWAMLEVGRKEGSPGASPALV